MDDFELRIVELDLTYPIPKLCNIGTIMLDPGTIIDGIVKNPLVLSTKLRDLWLQSGITCPRVLLGIGSGDILIRFTKIQKMEDSKIKSVLRLQSQDYFPVSINDYEMDFMTLFESKDDSNQEFKEIVIVASKNSQIKGYTSALEGAKLSPYEIDITSLSMMKYAEQMDKNSTGIIANIAYGKLDLLILKNSIPVFAKTALFNAKSLFEDTENTKDTKNPEASQEIQSPVNTINIQEKSPESFFIDFSASSISLLKESSAETTPDILLSSPNPIDNSIPEIEESPLFHEITSEIKSLMNYCFSLSDSEAPSIILLCGPVSRLDGLAEHIATQSMTKTIILDPFRDILVEENLRSKIKDNATDFSVCTSLALRGLEV